MAASSRNGKGRKPARNSNGPKRQSRTRGSRDTGRSGGSRAHAGERAGRTDQRDAARRDLKGAARELPRWVVDALSRVTPADRVGAALEALGEASIALGEGRFRPALRYARKAKELAPRDATIRETIGLASYRLGDWTTALRELRTYRRLSGETTHLPVEMDALRALGRSSDVEEAWRQFERFDNKPAVYKEGKVVYASFLMDEGRVAEARKIATPKSLTNNPHPGDLRLWYVASRAAALDGDKENAERLRNAILVMDPSFPGIEELDSTISSNAKAE